MAKTATSEIEQFIAANLVHCDKLAARLAPQQCATNRAEAKRRDIPGTLWHCLHCDGLPEASGIEAKPKRGRRRKVAPSAAQTETPAISNPRSPWRFNPARQPRQSTEIEVSDGTPCGVGRVRAPGNGVAKAAANPAIIVSEIEGGVPSSPAEKPAKSPKQTAPGIFVDFTGCEDLLDEFYLFVKGDLAVIRKGS